jgi:hypothetical protein
MEIPLRNATALPPAPAEPRRETRPFAPFADAVIQALTAPRPSLEDVRRAVERYARAARELAVAADEMLALLAPRVQNAMDALPSARREELLASVEWWAIHGYFGAE